MAELVSSDPSTHSGTRGAISLLEYLSSCGNMAAKTRLDDILQMCSHLHIETSGLDQNPNAPVADSMPVQLVPNASGEAQGGLAGQPWSRLEGLLNEDFDVFSLTQDEIDLAGVWQYNEISLDGTIETDWGNLERAAAPRFQPEFEE